MPAETIEAFAHCYFDVRDRLTASDYISLVVIGRKPASVLTEQRIETLWKHVAYFGGPRLLAALFDRTADQQATQELDRFLADDIRFTLLKKQFFAVHTLPINEKTALKTLELDARYSVEQESRQVPTTPAGVNIELAQIAVSASPAGTLPSLPESDRIAKARKPKRLVA